MKKIIFLVMIHLMALTINSYAHENYAVCVDDATHAETSKFLQEKFGEIKTINGVKYQTILIKLDSSSWAQTIRLLDQDEAIKRINQGLYNLLPVPDSAEGSEYGRNGNRTKRQVIEALCDCSSTTTEVNINYINKILISVEKHFTASCRSDGKWPDWTEASAWNLLSGKKINPWDWINSKGKVETLEASVALSKLIVSSLPTNEHSDLYKHCDLDYYNDNNYYGIKINEKGFTFTPVLPGAMKSCERPIFLSYKKLQWFLTKNAKEDIREYFGTL